MCKYLSCDHWPDRAIHAYDLGTLDGWPSLLKLRGQDENWVLLPCDFGKGRFGAVSAMRFSAEVKTGTAWRTVPTLRKEREEWGTHFRSWCRQLKGWATPPQTSFFIVPRQQRSGV